MNIYTDIPSPAVKEAGLAASVYGLQNHGLANLRRVYWNLSAEALYEEAVFRGEGFIASQGPFVVHTGKHTARAAADKFVVREPSSEDYIWWGTHNRPFSPGELQHAAGTRAGLPAGPRRVCSGLLRRRGS